MKGSQQKLFAAFLRYHRLPAAVPEYRFHPVRKWRWDYAWPDHRLALEGDGGIWVRGRHSRGSGIVRDHEKRNTAVAMGWRYLVVEPSKLMSVQTAAWIAEALQWNPPESRPGSDRSVAANRKEIASSTVAVRSRSTTRRKSSP